MPIFYNHMKKFNVLIIILIATSVAVGSGFFIKIKTEAASIVSLTSCGTLNQMGAVYQLQNNVDATGTCFSIQADNITLDLNGYTVTYGDQAPITIPNGSFENGTANWDFSKAPDASVQAGTFIPPTVWDGNYSVAFKLPITATNTITSAPVTLLGGVTYVPSAMFYNQADSQLSQTIEIDDAATGQVLSSFSNPGFITWRGFQLEYPNSYKPTTTESVVMKLSIGNGSPTATGYAYWDDARILLGPTNGIAARDCYNTGETTWSGSITYDQPCGGSANNFILKNGTITQGAGYGISSHAIGIYQVNYANNWQIFNNTLTVSGPKSQDFWAYESDPNLIIHDNKLISNVTTIERRDGFEGDLIYNSVYSNQQGATIYNNTLIGGPQGGIYSTGNGGDIYNNDINTNSKYTNDFGIAVGNNNANIYGNNIHPASGRGIVVSGTNDKIYNNTISVKELPQNQEYFGCEGSGAYGIQLRSSTDTEIYGNTVTSYADQCEARGIGLRTDPPLTLNNINIHNNTFTAIRVGSSSQKISDIDPYTATGTNISLSNNTFISDEYNYLDYWNGSSNLLLDSNTFAKGSNPASNYATFAFITGGASDLGMRNIDAVYQNGASGSSVYASANLTNGYSYSFTNEWRLHLTITNASGVPVSGANITVNDNTGAAVVSTTTAADGTAVFPLVQNKIYNTNDAVLSITPYTPHTLIVSAPNYNTYSASLTMDSPKTITVILSNKTSSDVNPPTLSGGSPSGTLSPGTTQTTLSVTTDENAICKYSTSPNTDYASMTDTFSTTGGTSHSTIAPGLTDGNSYAYYVRCEDVSGNADTSDYQISFSVAAAGGAPVEFPLRVGITAPTNFSGSYDDNHNRISLTWQNPSVSGFAKVIVVRKKDAIPASPTDGTVVYEGDSQQFTDTNVQADRNYYYAVFAYDNKSDVSESAKIEVIASAESEAARISVYNQFVPLDENLKRIYVQLAANEKISQQAKYALADFIENGSPSTVKMGAGERGAVLNSFKIAFNKLPRTESDWNDVLKIATGHVPTETNSALEKDNNAIFKKIYKRNPNLTSAYDKNAIMILTYGLAIGKRSILNEQRALTTYKNVFKKLPQTTEDWNALKAIAYSGAKR